MSKEGFDSSDAAHAIEEEQLSSFYNELSPEADYEGERYKFQGDILIVKSLVHLYDEVRSMMFTRETQKRVRSLIKDSSDFVYSLTNLTQHDVERMMNRLTIQEETLILSIPAIDVNSDLNIIFAEIEKMFFAELKRAIGGFERETATTGIVKQRQEYVDMRRVGTQNAPGGEDEERRGWFSK